MELDKTKPYGVVHGITGVKYTQNGRFFAPSGWPIDADQPEINSEKEPVEPKENSVTPESQDELLLLLDKTIPEIKEMLPALTADEVQQLYIAELNGKTRKSLISAIDEHRASV